ncbi:protein transport protein sec61 gamma subunit [Thermoplasma volcanium GSS1]|uniref:Protein transport protein sec61 gamma subunit n=1 Tax=Thermoplasma volcanium (strain ATCC 51530 / DSM 4299 / JCM 9571 / NBRC 15438 / GSS1) TaxID=273116 RepID=Q978E8_THEVO|nr:protein transport protein sec61 gamma subunit [Thermoplasma volcanium GSS1]
MDHLQVRTQAGVYLYHTFKFPFFIMSCFGDSVAIEDKAEEIQRNIERKFSSIGKGKYARILRMARKPTRDEYIKVLLITAIGLLIIGGVGFIIYLLMDVYFKLP